MKIKKENQKIKRFQRIFLKNSTLSKCLILFIFHRIFHRIFQRILKMKIKINFQKENQKRKSKNKTFSENIFKEFYAVELYFS